VNEDARDSQLWLISAASINIGFLAIKRSLWFDVARFCASPLLKPHKSFLLSRYYMRERDRCNN